MHTNPYLALPVMLAAMLAACGKSADTAPAPGAGATPAAVSKPVEKSADAPPAHDWANPATMVVGQGGPNMAGLPASTQQALEADAKANQPPPPTGLPPPPQLPAVGPDGKPTPQRR